MFFLNKSKGKKTAQLGLISCVAFAVGSMVGGGVFAVAGIVVNKAGPSAILSYLLAGIVVSLSALSFAVVASRAKDGQSGYAYLSRELGARWQFITMWAFYISTVTAVAFMLIAFGNYLQYFFPKIDAVTAAIIAILILMFINLKSILIIGKFETLLVGFKLTVILVMICYGFSDFEPQRFVPFYPHGTSPVISSAAMLFSSYLGFSVITNMAGVVKTPQKTVPRALILSIIVVVIVYVGVVFSLLMANVAHIGNAGLAEAAYALMGRWGGLLVAFAACVSTISGSNGSFFGISQLMVQMSTEKFTPSFFGRTSKSGNAQMSVIISGIIAIILILTGDIASIITYCSVAGIWGLIIMNIAAFKIGWKGWKTEGMKLPFGALIPGIATIAAVMQLPSLSLSHVLIGTGMVALGFIIYLFRPKNLSL